VQFVDMRELGRNPACIIPAWREFVRDASPGGPVLGIGEPVWPGRSDAELDECSRHEALLNLAFDGGRPWHLLCAYDRAALSGEVLDDACRSHPQVARDGISAPSPDYGPIARDDALPVPTHRSTELAFGRHDLALVRRFVALQAGAAGLAGERLEDVVLAVNELVANSIRHGGGEGVVRAWHDGGTFFCEVRDRGVIDDPLAGRERPSGLHDGGRGLWIVNHLCDLVQVRSSPTGTVVRLRLDLT
jgi:anti-sigma regulatory factor (Ser/Thr protein kinase)